MTVIQRFNDLTHLCDYVESSIASSNPIKLTPDNVQLYAETYSLHSSIINEVTQSPYPFYLYTFSKTSYRKNVHPYIPNVLYKRFYNNLKTSNIIREASGSIVLIHLLPFTQELFDSIANTSNVDNIKVLNQIMDNFSNVSADNQYYIDYIKSLESKCYELEQQNADLLAQVQNSKLITWY